VRQATCTRLEKVGRRHVDLVDGSTGVVIVESLTDWLRDWFVTAPFIGGRLITAYPLC
jgi:hypothetical protein